MPGAEIPRAGTPQRRGRPRGTRPRLADRGGGRSGGRVGRRGVEID